LYRSHAGFLNPAICCSVSFSISIHGLHVYLKYEVCPLYNTEAVSEKYIFLDK
jgi:hypothetical protein